jgi:hypothetical protein
MDHNLPLAPVRAPTLTGPGTQEDQLLSLMLTIIWGTRTGRTLPPVPVSELTADELIDFWDDDDQP